MRFSHDRRGQSVVIGTVILFGFLIVALGIYQVQVVPTENANVEFEHSQAVEDDFGDLRNDVLRPGSTGSTQIELGTRYPVRTFFVNPPPVSGSISTDPTGAIRIRNATVGSGAHPNAAAFWNTNRTFETRSLRYDADYNEFRDAPELVYEHSVVVAEFEDAILLRTGQTVVSDGRISLTALTGSVSENGVAPRSVDSRAVSASDTTLPLLPDGGRITLELPTAVDNASALADRWNRALPPDATATPNATDEAIRVTVENASDPYRLALSEVSLDNTGATEPAYVVSVGAETAAIGESIGVEVRDRYNNPVSDATVSFGGDNRTTGDGGRAFFEPTSNGPLTATINGTGGPTYESVTFDVSAGSTTASANRTYDVEWDEVDPIQIEEGTSEPLDILVTDASSGDPIEDAAVDVNFAPIGSVSGSPSIPDPSETGPNGRTTVSTFDTNEASAGDNFRLYATAGDDVDVLVVEVVESTTTYEIVSVDAQSGGGNSIDVTFDIDTTDPDAQVNVQSIRSNGNVRDETGLIDVANSQPQTVTIGGGNQAAEVRVILYDGAGNEQDRQEVPYP